MFYKWFTAIPFKVGLGALFVMLIAAVAFLGIISYRYSERTLNTAAQVTHSQRILDKSEEIVSILKDLQLESTAYFVYKDSSRKNDYEAARQRMARALEKLYGMVSDNPVQTARVDSLRSLVGQVSRATDEVLATELTTGHYDDLIRERLTLNTGYRTRVRALVNEIKNDEERLFHSHVEENRESVRVFKHTFFQMLAATATVLVVTFISIRYNFLRRLRVEADLRSANDLFAKSFYESPIAVAIVERDSGMILNCNEVFAKLMNRVASHIIGKTVVDVRLYQSMSHRSKVFAEAEHRGTMKYTELYFTPHKGQPMYVSISAQPIRLYGKECHLTAIMDLSAHKRAEETTQKALAAEMELNKMKSGFVTLASHEFRTPLTTILSSSHLLEKYATGQDKDRSLKHISRIKSSVNTLTSILDEFLSISRIEEGKVQPHIEEVNLKQMMEDLCEKLRTFAKPGQSIIYNHEGDGVARTDPVILSNIVNTLVSNAIKYSPEEAPINVTSRLNSKLQVVVSDSGIGIPAEDQRHLFQRFYRASNAGAIQGTGLGLHLLKRYVQMLDGEVRLESALGKGTRVDVTLAQPGRPTTDAN